MDIQQLFRRAHQLHHAGRLDEAEAAYRALLDICPADPELLNALAVIRQAKGDPRAAIALWMQALQTEPALPQALNNLGAALIVEGRFAEAEHSLQRAIAARSDYFQAYSNFGTLFLKQGRCEEAIEQYRRALSISPDYAEALFNLRDAYYTNGQIDQAVECSRRAIALNPNVAKAHLLLSTALLSRGDFEEGWREYQWRRQMPDFPIPRIRLPGASWDGSSLAGKTLLLYTEQGLGDAIHFVRFAEILAKQADKILVACPPELVRLFQTVKGIHRVFAEEEPIAPFDVHCSLLDLPFLLKLGANAIPSSVPYVRLDADLGASWKARMPAQKLFRIGVAWRGKSQNYLSQDAWSALTRIERTWVCSLQQGIELPSESGITIWPAPFSDLADTAALIEQLDLIITVDTAIAHLAGAMAKPVWILLKSPIDWRWLPARESSPWYPTARLFRIAPGHSAESTINAMIAQAAALVLAGERSGGCVERSERATKYL